MHMKLASTPANVWSDLYVHMILYVYVCYHGFLHVHTCTSIHPSVHPSASWICQLQRFWRFCRGVFSLPKKRHIRHRGHLDSTEWMGWDMLGSPRIVTSQNDAFFWGHDTDTGMCWDNLGQSKWIFHDRGPHLLTCWPQRDGHEFVQRYRMGPEPMVTKTLGKWRLLTIVWVHYPVFRQTHMVIWCHMDTLQRG